MLTLIIAQELTWCIFRGSPFHPLSVMAYINNWKRKVFSSSFQEFSACSAISLAFCDELSLCPLVTGTRRKNRVRNSPITSGIINSIDWVEIPYPYIQLSRLTAINGKIRKTREAWKALAFAEGQSSTIFQKLRQKHRDTRWLILSTQRRSIPRVFRRTILSQKVSILPESTGAH